ncbi:DUF2007 domain-containing protein, partial [Dysosmobacter welbionis]
MPLCTAVPLRQVCAHRHHFRRLRRAADAPHPGGGHDALPHHRRGQHHDYLHERHPPVLWRGGAGRPSGDLRHHRPELHAGGDHAPGRHFRRHRHHPGVQLRRP